MASPKIIPKKSVISKIPLSTDLENGEICINHADRKLYAKHPSSGAIQEIGAYEHSHDELYSLNGTQHLELQNNGSLVLNGSTTLTLPGASGTLATLDDITAGGVTSVNTYTGAVTLDQSDIGLSDVDNTSDADKPISTATQTALDGKASTSHTHSELNSPNSTKQIELQNNGDLTLPNGGKISDSAVAEGSITLTPPNAGAGQGLVIRPTVGVSLTNDVGFSAGATITVTLTDAGSHISDDWTANGGKDANWAYTITGITSGNLGSALTGTFAAADWFISGGNYVNQKVFNIPAGSTGTGFNIRLDDAITSAYSGYPTPPNLELTIGATSTLPETGHLHLVTADPTNVDLYLGDDYQFVKIERNAGGIVIGNNNNTKQWNFKTDGTLELPAGGDITMSGSSVLGGGGGGVQANWDSTSGPSSILNKPTLATVATSGSYTDLSSRPTLGTAAATDSTDYATAAQGATADSALQASALTPYRTSADQDTIDAGKATSAQGAKADSASQPGHGHSLSDITVSGATNGQVPAWNGTAWAPSTPAASGVTSVAGRSGVVTLAVTDVANAVGSVTTGIANTTPITNMMQITSAGYSAITPAANTLYIIVG